MPVELLAIIYVLLGSAVFFGLTDGFVNAFNYHMSGFSSIIEFFFEINIFGKFLMILIFPLLLCYALGFGITNGFLFLIFVGK